MAKLGEVIKNYRYSKSPKVTLDELARRSGLSKSYLSMAENNNFPRGKNVSPTGETLIRLATAMEMSIDDLCDQLDDDVKVVIKMTGTPVADDVREFKKKWGRKIPVLGNVAAGIPIEMIEDIIDYEEIPENMHGEYFGLKINGDSMEPRIYKGDVVIVRQQQDAESGDIVIVAVNGDSATCKRMIKTSDGITLLSLNPKYPPIMLSNEDIIRKPVVILGKVVELRGKLEF